MVFAIEEIERKCEICNKKTKYKTVGEPLYFEPIHYIHNVSNDKIVGVSILNHFICMKCAENFVSYILDSQSNKTSKNKR